MILSTIETHWIFVVMGILGTIISGGLIWIVKFWFDWKKRKREDITEEDALILKRKNENAAFDLKRKNEDAEAELLRRKNELSMINAPLNIYIQRLEEEVKTLKKDMTLASQQNLTKIFESITKETECQKKNAILEEKCRYLTEQVQELRQRISVLEKNNE